MIFLFIAVSVAGRRSLLKFFIQSISPKLLYKFTVSRETIVKKNRQMSSRELMRRT